MKLEKKLENRRVHLRQRHTGCRGKAYLDNSIEFQLPFHVLLVSI